ncbi:glycosyl hydrolase-related protein [Flagellimonas nanhaiensis]|uniref:Alpha-mannosidase n=1 Tax=Flagellimonas nanhaiensis TaxID=2292706 RepID=A0A371JTQ0_9FLAO|nr:glycosyl hydrolase-related protein [Allomuricauda nanhaiensis]RDY61139.1 alpha-mannosidase [Allomuricauda nanhaiensis]
MKTNLTNRSIKNAFLGLGIIAFIANAYSLENHPKLDKSPSLEMMAPFHGGGGHNHIYEINTAYKLYQVCKNDIEGFHSKIGGGDYQYPSIRDEVNQHMISRASTGEMYFEFLTNAVPNNYSGSSVTFAFYSNIDLNLREPYDVFANDQLVMTFIANEDGTLKILNHENGTTAEYILVKRDLNKDGVGLFRLTLPTSMVGKGKQARIKVQGHKKGSNSWFMLAKANNLLENLRMSSEQEASFSIKTKDGIMHIDAPTHFAGKQVQVISDGKKSKKVVFSAQGELAKASIRINAPKKEFKIVYGDDSIEFPLENGIASNTSDILGAYFYVYNAQIKNGWQASITKLYKPSLFNAYDDFFDRRNEGGKVSVMNSSHQDIAWVDRPEICIILRDTLVLTPVINDAFERPDYGFDIEDGLMLREYLNRHPDAQEKLTTLLNKKLVSVGASYNCPYEDMYDGEDLVRQFYLGKKWVKKTFGGYDSKVYWNVDVPGKTLQFPQIMKKAGVEYMVISRHAKGMFNWESPDGSSVFTYSPGHYGNDIIELSKELSSKMKYAAEQVTYWKPSFEEGKTITPLLSSQDMIPAMDYSDFIEAWNSFESVKDGDGNENQVYFPDMELMTADEFMPLARKNATKIETIRGERPNVWVYIHGPAHHEALTASREASKLLPAAEKFLAIANTLDSKRMPYPFEDFDKAWQSKIYPDHGWGGHDGDITDDLFKEKLMESKTMGTDLLKKGTNFIANRIKTDDKKGIPVVLFNSLSWERTDPITVSINLEKGKAKSLQVYASDKKKAVAQISNKSHYDDGTLKSADVVFIAENVPAIGYKTYYVKPSLSTSKKTTGIGSASTYENEFYKIEFEKGGIGQIFDKELKRNLFKTNALKAGEVFTLHSQGNGAGEFGDIQQPFMKDFDKVSNHDANWEIVKTGGVFTTYRIKQPILHAIVEQDVTIYHKLKRVLFETRLLNWSGELYREFRTAFPVAIDNALVKHEVPFGAVKVGQDEIETAGDRYTALAKDVHPRAIMDWFSASDDDLTVTLSSSVAAFDWMDPTTDSEDTLLQHLLLASRTSCHWEGNEYSQAGDHSYHNILTSHKTGSLEGMRVAEQQNDPLRVVVYPDRSAKASLPDSLSFFNIDQGNINVTTIKKAEDSEDLIIRMYDAEGKDTQVKLSSFFTLENLQKTNIIEENPRPATSMDVSKYGIETYSFEAKNK